MSTARWFLAHDKSVEEDLINMWAKELKELLASPGFEVEVTSGRDDYIARSAALGGWARWCGDVPHGRRYDGDPMFHGVVVPVSPGDMKPLVGKATCQIVAGFISEMKHAYTWCPASGEFQRIEDVQTTDMDDWRGWAQLILEVDASSQCE
tara:strand:+ start:2848 stop:3300 length:453 start_codon:yes stop_codon:yes gene_type:complete